MCVRHTSPSYIKRKTHTYHCDQFCIRALFLSTVCLFIRTQPEISESNAMAALMKNLLMPKLLGIDGWIEFVLLSAFFRMQIHGVQLYCIFKEKCHLTDGFHIKLTKKLKLR